MSRPHILPPSALCLVFALLAMPGIGFAQVPPDYPAGYADTVAAARREGRLVVYATTDTAAVAPLNRAFEERYPGVKVEYREMESNELNRRFMGETATGRPSADVLWSSAMDLQFKLVNDRYAEAYASPESGSVPEWANWRNEAYGTTFEPVVFAYNERLLRGDDIPQTHADFAQVLKKNPGRFRGKVTTYDVEKSAVGSLLAAQDSRASPAFWDLTRLLGAADVRLETSTAAMMERIGSGAALLGYNMIGSYVMARAELDPSVAVVLPRDYTLVLSRVVFISKSARDPNAARLWLDFLLSRRGQGLLSEKSKVPSIRRDISGPYTADALVRTLGASLRPVVVGPGLLVHLDRFKQQEFLKQWRGAMESR